MDPATTIIRKLGGPNVVARVAGVHRTRVSSWQRARTAGGTGGQIPQRHIRALLAYAQAQGVPLTANDFYAADAPSPDRTEHPLQTQSVEA